MKSTVIRASEATAKEVAADLLARNDSKGNPIFRRTETAQGFEINATFKGEAITVFRYTNEGGRKRFDYDERLLSF